MITERPLSDQYANEKGFLVRAYLLDCVKNGSRGKIEKLFVSGHLDEIERLLANDLPLARRVFSFIWPQVVYAAIEGGAPALVCNEYGKYYHGLQHARSVSSILEMHRRIFADFADKVILAKNNRSPLVYKVNRYITSHLRQRLTVNLLAQKFRYSRSYLSREYRKETGETIQAKIQREKILEAKRLLCYSSQSLIDIGDKLCFCSQAHFAKIFRKKTGITPGRYRKMYQNESGGCKPEDTVLPQI
jgi:AraC-like DNA-binding protein